MTDETGRYFGPSLSVGNYQIRAEKEGFTPVLKKGVALAVGERLEVDLELPIGPYSQVVTVSEQPNVVSVSTQSSGGLASERQVKELPATTSRQIQFGLKLLF